MGIKQDRVVVGPVDLEDGAVAGVEAEEEAVEEVAWYHQRLQFQKLKKLQ